MATDAICLTKASDNMPTDMTGRGSRFGSAGTNNRVRHLAGPDRFDSVPAADHFPESSAKLAELVGDDVVHPAGRVRRV